MAMALTTLVSNTTSEDILRIYIRHNGRMLDFLLVIRNKATVCQSGRPGVLVLVFAFHGSGLTTLFIEYSYFLKQNPNKLWNY